MFRRIVEDDESVDAEFTYENKNYIIQLMITDRTYEFIFMENWSFNYACYLVSCIIIEEPVIGGIDD